MSGLSAVTGRSSERSAELWSHGFAWQSRALSAATVSAWVLVLTPVSLALGAPSELVSLLLSIA